jgi:murein DD-endopeptidase MepM/ murein hydrolase activator NlpD
MGVRVLAIEAGTIVRLGGQWRGGQGNPDGFNVTIKAWRRSWFYTHLESRENLTVGQRVNAGDLLGRSGAANGVPHLHLGLDHGNPEAIIRGLERDADR